MSIKPLEVLLAEIEARVDAATEGPWIVDGCGELWYDIKTEDDTVLLRGPKEKLTPDGYPLVIGSAYWQEGNPNSTFISHARIDVPRLIKALRFVATSLECNETFSHRLSGIGDCDPCKMKRSLAAILGGME